MVFKKLKKNRENDNIVIEENDHQHILIVEDDPDQMSMLVHFTLTEMQTLLNDGNLSEEQENRLKLIKVISSTNIESLSKAVSKHKNILLALLDCNIPDKKGGAPHDQFIKVSHAITGRHKSVDLITENLPGTPITMISTLNRFEKIVHKYYQDKGNLDINFIHKKDQQMIRRNVGYYIRQYLKL